MFPILKGSKSDICDYVFDMYSEETSVKDRERKRCSYVVPIKYFKTICFILVKSATYFQNSKSNINLFQVAHNDIIIIYFSYIFKFWISITEFGVFYYINIESHFILANFKSGHITNI